MCENLKGNSGAKGFIEGLSSFQGVRSVEVLF